MPNYIVQGSDLSSVATAIRTKGSTSAQLAFPTGFVSAIEALPTGGGGLGDFELLDTVTVSEAVSQVSLSIPTGYTQIGISYSVEMSVSTKANFYHTSVSTSHLMDASGTGTSKTGAFVVHGMESCTIDGNTIAAKTVCQTTSDQAYAPINMTSPPSTIVCACNTSGATITGGTFKIYGR